MEEEPCNTRLTLGLGGGGADIFGSSNRRRGRQRKAPVDQRDILFPPPCAREGEEGEEQGMNRLRLIRTTEEREGVVGRERGGARKKLRLTNEQSSLLESTFREHSVLTPVQKQDLADKLNLRPRQVEVWFQNRRARTKLKQTEVDCEFLKKCCESLSDENMRLKKELAELRSTRPAAAGSPLYAQQLPRAATTLTVCPSCERVAAAGGNKGAAAGAAKNHGFYDCTNVKDSSMAC